MTFKSCIMTIDENFDAPDLTQGCLRLWTTGEQGRYFTGKILLYGRWESIPGTEIKPEDFDYIDSVVDSHLTKHGESLSGYESSHICFESNIDLPEDMINGY